MSFNKCRYITLICIPLCLSQPTTKTSSRFVATHWRYWNWTISNFSELVLNYSVCKLVMLSEYSWQCKGVLFCCLTLVTLGVMSPPPCNVVIRFKMFLNSRSNHSTWYCKVHVIEGLVMYFFGKILLSATSTCKWCLSASVYTWEGSLSYKNVLIFRCFTGYRGCVFLYKAGLHVHEL